MSQDLRQLRKKIDQADRALIKALGNRFKAVKEVGVLKRKLKLQIVQKSRWNEVLRDRIRAARSEKVSITMVKKIFEIIHGEAIRIQRRKK